jgi:Zn ribbon nucleic-acid-binding protein
MSNYPPGVTGNEFPITGPLDEWVEDIDECPACHFSGQADAWWHPDQGAWVDCPRCGHEMELPDPREPDPDLAYDTWRDMRDGIY